MWKIWRRLIQHKMFTRYLLVTNMAISGTVDGVGDHIEQKIEGQESVSWSRSGRMSLIGVTMGIPDHFWYKFLDKRFPQRHLRVVAKKAVIDSLVMGPPHIIVFYLGMCLMEGQSWQESVRELKEKFLVTFLISLLFWPPVQLVNFYYLPTSLRVLYINIADLFGAVLFSRLKHTDMINTMVDSS